MKTKDYIKAKALGTINSAIHTLSDLVPKNLESIIKEDEYSIVLETLTNWQDRLYSDIETEE